MTTEIYSPSNPSDWCALDDNDIEQQICRRHPKPSYWALASHYDPLNPEQSFRNIPPYSSSPLLDSHYDPLNPEQSFHNIPPYSSSPLLDSHYDPLNPEQSFHNIPPYSSSPLDDGFDDQFPAKFDLSYPVIGVRDDQAPDLKDASGNSKGKSTTVESIGTAANKWNKKESASVNKAANTPGEEETGGRDGEEFRSRETGHFARKCSLGADGGKTGGQGGGNIGRALCTRMP